LCAEKLLGRTHYSKDMTTKQIRSFESLEGKMRNSTSDRSPVTNKIDVEQDHDSSDRRTRPGYGHSSLAGCDMYHIKYCQRKGVQTGMLCKQGLLQHIAQTHRITDPAVSQGGSGAAECHRPARDLRGVAGNAGYDRVACFLQHEVQSAFAAAPRADLYSSHLIQRA
jgi:hypothetical protein